MLARLHSSLRAVFGRSDFERGMEDEIHLHLDNRTDDLVRSGLPEPEAARRARVEFGGVELYKERCREALGLRLLDELRADLRYAFRGLSQNPGFALVAILTLALAIGANTSLFTFLNAYIFRPFPIHDSHRNVQLAAAGIRSVQDNWSYPDFADLRDHSRAFEELYASSGRVATLRDPAPRTVRVGLVSGNLFRLLGGHTVLGRAIVPADDQAPGRDPVVVLAHSAWQRIFGGDPGVIGKPLRLNHTTFTVIGVAEPGFAGSEPLPPDLWAPLMMFDQASQGRTGLADRQRTWLIVGGLLKPGLSLEQARDSLSALLPELNTQRPPDAAIRGISLTRWSTVFLINSHTLQAITAFLAAFGLILLIACANLASLLLARATSRQREFAVRLSLGASRTRLVRQLLTESLLLSSIGAVLGLLLTQATTGAIQRYLFSPLARIGLSFEPIGPDWRVYLYTAALALLAAVAFGLVPALAATESALASNIRQESPSPAGGPRPHRVRDVLVVGEVAASLILLVAAAILVRAAQRVAQVRHGYDLDHTIAVQVNGSRTALTRRLESDPRFISFTEAYQTPLLGSLPQLPARVADRSFSLGYSYVDHRYFETLGIPLRRGRGFTLEDTRAQSPVAVVSETTARRLWPETDPVGQSFQVDESRPGARVAFGTYRVIGVAGDVVNGRLDEGPDWSSVYLPASHSDPRNGLLVRVAGDPAAGAADLRNVCFDLDPRSSCDTVLLADRAWLQRFPFVILRDLSVGVGALALGLTCIGLSGVVAYSAARRKREIGIRMALGAPRARVLASMLAESARRVAAGIAIGVPLCLALSYAASQLEHVADLDTFDLSAYLAAPVLVCLIALAACYLPARQATLVDPIVVLRQE